MPLFYPNPYKILYNHHRRDFQDEFSEKEYYKGQEVLLKTRHGYNILF